MPGFPHSAHIGYLFTDGPLTERVTRAAQHGFDAVEHPSPYAVPAAEMARRLDSSGLRWIQLGLASGDPARGEKGLAIFPERRAEFRASVTRALDYAEVVGAGMVHAMAGILPRQQRTAQHWDCYLENLAHAAAQAQQRGIKVIVEAMSQSAVPNYFVDTPDRAARAIDEAGGSNLGLLLDVFHTASSGLDIEAEISKHAGILAHVHIADFPGRHEPGTGALDFDAVNHVLADASYRGVLGCEYVPVRSTEAGLGWLTRDPSVGRRLR